MSTSSGTHENVVKTRLDNVLFGEYDREEQPDYLSSRNSVFFKQMNIDRQARIYEEDSNVGDFVELQENEVLQDTATQTKNLTTRTVRDFHKTLFISRNLFDDDQHDVVDERVRQVGDRGRLTQDKRSILDTYGDGFDGNINTTPDGQALYSNSHTAVNGDTIDNLETGKLTPDGLKTVIRALRLQKAQDGELGGHRVVGLLTPTILYDEALEITKSDKVANSAENNLNFFNTIYGELSIKTSEFLDSDFNSATNANTSYYVVGRNHTVTRDERQTMGTVLVPWQYDDRNRYVYKADYREMYYPGSWEGTVASNGTV